MADCEVLEKDCSHFIPGLFGSLISTVLIALSLFAFEWRMALAALWVIPVSAAIVVGSYRVQDKVQARTMAAKMACADGIQEYIETLRDLKASNAEQRYLSGLSDKIRAVEKQSIVAELETALFVSSAGMVLKLGIASVALTGSVLLVQGSIDVLTLFLFLMAASRMYDPMQGALQNLAAVIAMRTNVGRMNEILDASLQTGSEQLTNQGCDIVFDHVGFAYQGGETVLKDVSFTIEPGQKVAFVGATGAGKSSILNLIGRYYDVQKGSIRVDGVDVRDLTRDQLRAAIGQVQQDVFIFTGDIKSNIRLRDEEITDEQVHRAAEYTNASRFIERLPNGYDEHVTERGATFSAGQRQLLSFARTLAHDPKILILDEATANIDTETEQWIQEALERLMQGRTSIMVAHRLSTIQHADRIIVMHHGRIRESGTHQELLKQDGIYKKLYELQLA